MSDYWAGVRMVALVLIILLGAPVIDWFFV